MNLHNLLQLIMHRHIAPCNSHIQAFNFHVDKFIVSREIVVRAYEEHIDGSKCEVATRIHNEDERESIETEKPGVLPIESKAI